MVVRAAAIWLLLLVVAVTLGTLRALIIEPALGEQTAHVTGTLLVVAAFVFIIASTVRWIDPRLRIRQLAGVGFAWMFATILFEFGFGHYVAGHPWERLFLDYDVVRGRIWVLVPATVLFTPVVMGSWRNGGEP